MYHKVIRYASFLGALTVALGAFGAHGLKKIVPPFAVDIFETGVRYQFYHVFALLIAGYLYSKYSNKLIFTAIVLFVTGIILFSGSLYLMTFIMGKGIQGYEWIGPITPVGGLAFIVGWIFLGLGVSSSKKNKYKSHHS